jgi:hypothetical protein
MLFVSYNLPACAYINRIAYSAAYARTMPISPKPAEPFFPVIAPFPLDPLELLAGEEEVGDPPPVPLPLLLPLLLLLPLPLPLAPLAPLLPLWLLANAAGILSVCTGAGYWVKPVQMG